MTLLTLYIVSFNEINILNRNCKTNVKQEDCLIYPWHSAYDFPSKNFKTFKCSIYVGINFWKSSMKTLGLQLRSDAVIDEAVEFLFHYSAAKPAF